MSPSRKSGTYREGRDDARRIRERYDIAFEEAKKIHDRRRKELKAQGYSGKALEEKVGSLGDTADFLVRTKARELDRIADERRRRLERQAERAKDSRANPGTRTAKEMKNLAEGFKARLDERRRIACQKKEQNETRTGKTRDVPKQPNAAREKSDNQKALSLRDVLNDARQIKQDRIEPVRPSSSLVDGAKRKSLETRQDARAVRKDGRGEHREITMPPPMMKGERIESFKELKKRVESEYTGLRLNQRYDEWMRDAENYMKLYDILSKNPNITPEKLRQASRNLGIYRNKAEGWIHQEKVPRVFKYMNQALSRTEGQELARSIRERLNGADTLNKMKERLSHFYLQPELENLKGHKMHSGYAEAFYKFLSTVEQGGLAKDIGKEVRTDRKGVEKWIEGELPRLPRIASEIPREAPDPGNKWLPLKVEGKSFKDFIQVPEKIGTYEDVVRVLEQLQSRESKQMKERLERFGEVSMGEALMYTLGIASSDGGFKRGSMTERLQLELATKYDWSERVGEATCYYLGVLGVKTARVKDRTSKYVWNGETRESPRMGWISEYSPFVNWLKRSGLGFELEHSKSQIDADWMLGAPRSWRVAYIQGVADGDGWVASMNTGISTNSEFRFYSSVLNSLGIESKSGRCKSGKGSVKVIRKAAIQDAAGLPLFRHATGRMEKLEELSKMHQESSKAGLMNDGEKSLIAILTNEGLSSGEIRKRIWADIGISRSTRAIWAYRKKLAENS